MSEKGSQTEVGPAFESETIQLQLTDIQPLRLVSQSTKLSPKYCQIAASVADVGLVEAPVVARGGGGKFLLLDGHLRLEVLRDMGETQVMCLISTDDEAYTYNVRVNRIAIIQEHKMILRAIERGVPEARLAKALNIEVSSLRHKANLLQGICAEAVELLKDRHATSATFEILRKMAPMRQIEAAELMIAMNAFSKSYAEALLASTPQSQLADPKRRKAPKAMSAEQVDLMERESANLEREFRVAEETYGADHLDLVLAKGYLGRLLGNARVVRHLAQHHREILNEFQRIVEPEGLAS